LSRWSDAPSLREEHVIGGVGVEGRVEIDQVHALVFDVALQDIEVIAVIEGVHVNIILIVDCKRVLRSL